MDTQLSKPEAHVSVGNTVAKGAAGVSATRQHTDIDMEAARSVGRKLAQLREARHLKIDDVSAHLKVPAARLQALEMGDLDTLLDMTFVIGIVRSYSKMLSVDPTPFVDELRRARSLPEPHLALPGFEGVRLPKHDSLAWTAHLQRRRWWRISGVFALILVFFILLLHQYGSVLAVRFMQIHPRLPVAGVSTEPSSEETSIPDRQSADASAPASETSAPESSDTQYTADVRPLQNHNSSTLHFKVSQDTWISVRRDNGQSVYMGLLSAGEERDVQGDPPLHIIVGNVSGLASLEWNGQPVERSKYKPTENNVARFSVP